MRRVVAIFAVAATMVAASQVFAQTAASGASAPAVAAPGGAPPGLSPVDRRFARAAAQGNVGELMTARLALGRSSNADVKSFAQKMIDDHTVVGAKLKTIADAKGMTLPTGPDASHRAVYNRLAKLHGAAFDQAYLAGQKTDHLKLSAVLGNESRSGKDPDLMGFAAATAPTVQQHLDMLQKMPMDHQS